MNETPLMMTPSSGKTWAQKGSLNVFSFGSKDKRQITGTPWINYNGDIVLFHTTVRGKTVRSLPKPVFLNQQKFKEPYHSSKIKFIPQPKKQRMDRRIRQGSHILC